MADFLFHKSLIIGVGLIGSSIARALRKYKISSEIYGIDSNADVLEKCNHLNILTSLIMNQHFHFRSPKYKLLYFSFDIF